jgi:primosomal protein N' (replication factor Y)
LGEAEAAIASLFAAHPEPLTRRHLLRLGASPHALAKLVRLGKVVEVPLPPPAPPGATPPLRLSPAQEDAVHAMVASMGGRFLLYGPTGSGKTEVYLALARQVLAAGRKVLILVPEIALTPQTARRLREGLGERVEVVHSARSRGELREAWERLATGESRVAVGARSAVWAPLHPLGLVVVDEEGDPSYQSERVPRYDARRVAEERARREGATLVLASATPSLESLVRAQEGEDLALVPLPRRAEQHVAQVVTVDLRKPGVRPRGLLSVPLRQAMEEALARGEQAILLLNRRGLHPVCLCRDCGHTLTCPACDVSYTLYRSGQLLCHYCGRAEPVPSVCPSCRGHRLRGLGAGTERLEEEVTRLFPQARVVRLDRDRVRRPGEAERVVEAFLRHEADVLVGTQMVAQGHHLPQVTLVGVVLADQGLRYPDFRAAERTAQLLVQAAGRAGRGHRPGKVVLQTYDPQHPAILVAASGDYLAFARSEARSREELGYPPAGALGMLTARSPQPERAQEAAQRAAEVARSLGVQVRGPAPPPVPRQGGQYRWQVLVKASSPVQARQLVREVRKALPHRKGVEWDVRVDPPG